MMCSEGGEHTMKSEIYTDEAFAMKMDAFIAFCESCNIDATDYQLIKFFGITTDELEEYSSGHKLNENSNRDNRGYSTSLKKLDLYREDATIHQAVTEPKLASHCALKLRQLHWGGWNDKAEAPQDITIHIKIGDGDRELTE
jgi:hypothetical protein